MSGRAPGRAGRQAGWRAGGQARSLSDATDDMLQIADVLRNCLRYVPQSSASLCDRIKHHCTVFENMRDSLVVQTVQLLQRSQTKKQN